jgi:tripartite-type tricarboxylate transporter receptor subunit TctC
MFDNLGNTRDHIKDNRLKLLAVTTERRIPQFPDAPAVAEMFPGVLYTSWFALVAPPKTPPAIVAKLHAAIADVLQIPDVVRRLAAMSVSPGGMSPLETTALIRDESERWRKIIQATGIKSD